MMRAIHLTLAQAANRTRTLVTGALFVCLATTSLPGCGKTQALPQLPRCLKLK